MEIIVYADESGTFDYLHNDYFVFGGLIFLDRNSRDIAHKKYLHVEHTLRKNKYPKSKELKACLLSNGDKGKIYRSLNNEIKFAVIIDQKKINKNIFDNKKSKQRYLDFAFKIGLKRCLEYLIYQNMIIPNNVEGISVLMDEHNTATNGRYELRELLEQEFKHGTFNWNYNIFYNPLFPKIKYVDVEYCNSSKKSMIRAADIIANKVYYLSINQKEIPKNNICVTYLP